MTARDQARLNELRANARARKICGFLWLGLGAVLIGLILCAPVMHA